MSRLFRKVFRHVHEVPPPVDQAVCQDGLELFGSIAAEGVYGKKEIMVRCT